LPSECAGPWASLKSLFDAERDGGAAPADAGPKTVAPGGCGCELGRAARSSACLALAAVIAAFALRRRRRHG
jgi:MYXO-CTERM domain-containing protein